MSAAYVCFARESPLRVTAVIFDLDGTLIDSAGDLLRAANRMLGETGLEPLSAPEFQSMIGDGVDALVARVLAARQCASVDPIGAARRFLEHYSAEPTTLTRTYPGAHRLLETLQALGKKLPVCTNKPTRFVHQILERLSLDRYFNCVLGGDSLPFRKPDPRVVLEALKALETPASSALFVGDSEVDAATCTAARMPFVLMTHGYHRGPIAEIACVTALHRFEELGELIS